MAYKFPTDRAIIVPVTKVHRMLCGGAIVFATFLPGTARLATLLTQTCVFMFAMLFLIIFGNVETLIRTCNASCQGKL